MDAAPDILFYDGGCGLCHSAVKVVLRGDADGRAFRFAPLHGETFLRLVPEADRASLPDSLVVRTDDGRLLSRSAASLYIGRRLGGLFGVLAALGSLVPRRLADALYDTIARVRHRLFARPDAACPLLPPPLRARFLP
jgi:predicted DCC family thiol-disulfide oxidoreductase YuxK